MLGIIWFMKHDDFYLTAHNGPVVNRTRGQRPSSCCLLYKSQIILSVWVLEVYGLIGCGFWYLFTISWLHLNYEGDYLRSLDIVKRVLTKTGFLLKSDIGSWWSLHNMPHGLELWGIPCCWKWSLCNSQEEKKGHWLNKHKECNSSKDPEFGRGT